MQEQTDQPSFEATEVDVVNGHIIFRVITKSNFFVGYTVDLNGRSFKKLSSAQNYANRH